MALSRFQLVVNQPADEADDVWLTCSDGTTTYIVSARRVDLETVGGQHTKEAQDDVVQRNVESLAPVIEAKIERGELAQWTNSGGQISNKVEWSRADLEQGIKPNPPPPAPRQVFRDERVQTEFGGQGGFVAHAGIVGDEPEREATGPTTPVQSYLVTTPLNFEGAA